MRILCKRSFVSCYNNISNVKDILTRKIEFFQFCGEAGFRPQFGLNRTIRLAGGPVSLTVALSKSDCTDITLLPFSEQHIK